eukprot:CAMPEP_0174266098 /NCGR_PEP_ID=MMETSP0439-20130205/28907_1 /TAXON_ID=0 /ORGANISM="Stereomyxa ramosa, Strain Chinc5" /LENGTH=378 /DNA_ID=CAMNT_0015352865 /DNA_START=1794 /DNA_END=2930 /DNA_ORIENTATION=+
MSNNTQPSQSFQSFLNLIGQQIELLGWKGYSGGLDNEYGSTGKYSLFTTLQPSSTLEATINFMFHVSTMLPHHPTDIQQVEKKRHLGNDVVVIVFKDKDKENKEPKPFDPSVIKSHFNHVFLVVSPVTVDSRPCYRVKVLCGEGVPPFGPPLPEDRLFKRDSFFRTWLLTKAINGERSAMRAPAFVLLHKTARKDHLNDFIDKLLSELPAFYKAITQTGATRDNVERLMIPMDKVRFGLTTLEHMTDDREQLESISKPLEKVKEKFYVLEQLTDEISEHFEIMKSPRGKAKLERWEGKGSVKNEPKKEGNKTGSPHHPNSPYSPHSLSSIQHPTNNSTTTSKYLPNTDSSYLLVEHTPRRKSDSVIKKNKGRRDTDPH